MSGVDAGFRFERTGGVKVGAVVDADAEIGRRIPKCTPDIALSAESV
ncbi:MAG: hypothetical protein KIT09_18535 [Bryobacteraceae bacterium]|nr:hypothetical protein [Bryobacteraceae bacterium]